MQEAGNSMLVLALRWMLAAASAVLFLTALASPLLAAGGRPEAGMLCRGALASACHQKPERSIMVSGFPMGLCARCSAIYGSLPLAFAAFSLLWPRPRAAAAFPAAALGLLPMALDGTMQALSLYDAPALRLLTGAMAGAATALLWHTLFSGAPKGVSSLEAVKF